MRGEVWSMFVMGMAYLCEGRGLPERFVHVCYNVCGGVVM